MKQLFTELRNDPDFYEEFLDFYDGPEEQARNYFDYNFENFLSRLNSLQTHDLGVLVWRVINVKDITGINLNNIGASWSYNKSTAHAWYGGDGQSFLIEAVIPFSEIDIETTLRQNLVNAEEEEFRLNPEAEVFILKIYDPEGKELRSFDEPQKSSSGKIGIFGDWNE